MFRWPQLYRKLCSERSPLSDKLLVEEERQRRGERDTPPYYLKYFEKLANDSEEYLKNHYPNYLRLVY